jgi:hypothetical protein
LDDPAIRTEATTARAVIAALAEELRNRGPLVSRDEFRAAASEVRARTGQKGKALFHPIRLALTGEAEGVELDLAVPAIEQGALLDAGSTGISSIPSAAQRAADFHDTLERLAG